MLPHSLTFPAAVRSRMPLRARERTMISAPMCSRWGFVHFALSMRMAATLVLYPEFDPVRTLACLQEHEVGTLVVNKRMLQQLAAVPYGVLTDETPTTLRVLAVPSRFIAWDTAAPIRRRFGDVLYHRDGQAVVRLDDSWARECAQVPDAGGGSAVEATAPAVASSVRSPELSPGA